MIKKMFQKLLPKPKKISIKVNVKLSLDEVKKKLSTKIVDIENKLKKDIPIKERESLKINLSKLKNAFIRANYLKEKEDN